MWKAGLLSLRVLDSKGVGDAVQPGQEVVIPFVVTAPVTGGQYNFQWRMVQDGVQWFGDLTDNVQVTVTAPQFYGSVDSTTSCNGSITGWAWDASRPYTPVEVDLFDGDAFLTRTVSDGYRAGLGGDARHAFSVPVPSSLRDGAQHTVTARFANTLFLANNVPPFGSANLSGCSAAPASLAAPGKLSVNSVSDSYVKLKWESVVGATGGYVLERRQRVTDPYVVIATPAASPYQDNAVTARTSYLYRLRAVGSDGSYSPYGGVAMGTTFTFEDSDITADFTPIRAQHYYQLRQAIDAVRVAAVQTPASWTDADLTGKTIKGDYLTELRANLNQALSVLGMPQAPFTDPIVYKGDNGTPIKKVHIDGLRHYSTGASGGGNGPASVAALQGFAQASRLLPANRTGRGGGIDLLSGNFNWSLPLVSLPGRAGLDLGLTLSYNSLVWTKDAPLSSVVFDADGGFPGPGFRLGLPVIEPLFFDPQSTSYSYLLVTPSGARVALRQIGTSSLYESADSTYLRYDASLMVLSAPDGSRLTYGAIGGEYRCTQVEDRNGNRLSVLYNYSGQILSVTDTLGRIVSFQYDSNNNPLSITQAWGSQTHTWATFSYGAVTVQPSFSSGLTVGGPQGQAINVLTQVGIADGSRYQFDYNLYGQVSKIARYSADNHLLSYTAYDYNTGTGECPKVSAERAWAIDWNNNAEVTTTYGYADDRSWGQVTTPDQTVYKELFATTGWQKGLTTGTEIWVGGVKEKWTSDEYTQDDTSLSYRLNPRQTESNIYDADGNRRRTRTDYYPAVFFNLPSDVYEYAADAMTVLRRTHTDYLSVLDPATNTYVYAPGYAAQRLVGLVSGSQVYGRDPDTGSERLYSKVAYAYDETGEGRLAQTTYNGSAVEPTMHDSSAGASFTVRGNVTSVTRWNVGAVDANNPASVTSKAGYDIAGCTIFSIDPLGHRAEVSYDDRFSDANNARNTFAYPTAVTDPDQSGQVSPQRALTTYEFSTGAVTRTQGVSPDLTHYPTGPVRNVSYDEVGRVAKVELETGGDGATLPQASRPHTSYVYSVGQTWVKSLTTVRDASTEVFSIQIMDGAGRAYASAADFPGTGGGYSAQHTVYDVMGQAVVFDADAGNLGVAAGGRGH